MTAFSLAALLPAAPELLLAAGALVLVLIGAFGRHADSTITARAAVGVLLLALTANLLEPAVRVEIFSGAFVMDGFARFMKALVLAGACAAVLMAAPWMRREAMDRFEFPVLVLLATLGMCMMISAGDLISMYLALELQGLALYVAAALRRDSARASEAGLKYFVLGALSSGMLLYGCSLAYGLSGMTTFAGLAALPADVTGGIGLTFAMVFILAGLAFKMAAAPFHMWTPDVYEGAPAPVTAFFAGAPKVAALALFARVTMEAFGPIDAQWRQVVIFLALFSMVLGAFAAIGQRNIKRLMAYSSIGHVGAALVGLAAGTSAGLRGLAVYLAIYLVMNIGVFCCILAMRRDTGAVEDISDLAGMGRQQPGAAFLLAMLMFSLAGVPPLAGFFAKFYVFLAAVEAGLYVLAVVGVLSSVVAAFYYLRIVRIIYFDEPAAPLETPMPGELRMLLTVSGLLVILFAAWPAVLLGPAALAAEALAP